MEEMKSDRSDEKPNVNFPPDYSDVPSDSQEESKGKRRYERGGRKKANGRQQHAIPDRTSAATSAANSAATGIRAFNIRRAQSSGGRPFGVTVEKNESGQKSTKESKEGGDDQDDEDYDEQQVDEERPQEKQQQEKPGDEEKRKPLSIRLDLNLELEIFLKAKIKGDVTITFLE